MNHSYNKGDILRVTRGHEVIDITVNQMMYYYDGAWIVGGYDSSGTYWRINGKVTPFEMQWIYRVPRKKRAAPRSVEQRIINEDAISLVVDGVRFNAVYPVSAWTLGANVPVKERRHTGCPKWSNVRNYCWKHDISICIVRGDPYVVFITNTIGQLIGLVRQRAFDLSWAPKDELR
jgi:hypothetical protein